MFPTSNHLRRFLLAVFLITTPALADEPPKPESALVRLLKSGRIPEERQPQIIAKIGQLGSADDLGFLFERALDPKGFSPAIRENALGALANAALTRNGIRPTGELKRLETLLQPPASLSAIHLAGLWRLESTAPALSKILENKSADDSTILAALDSLAALGEVGRPAIESMASPDRPKRLRMLGVAALAKIEPNIAAGKAAELIRDADRGQDFSPLIAAFLDRKDGAVVLAKAIEASKLPPDNAKLALRATYAIGRSDPPLIDSLSKAAGIESETKPPTKEEMDRLVADVASKGDAARGERILRRADLNCMKCHSIAGAAGGVGPDLASIGLSAPVDFVINSILLPDQAIKEQYQTLAIATNDGQIFQGIVADKDESKVVLKQASGELKTIPTSEIDESKEGGSLMPKGLANLITRDEFVDLVRFLSELGKPGVYAIRDTPTIQRWRLMKPIPEDLTKDVPDNGQFVAKVRDSDPSAWTAAYALSTGELPLDEFASLAGNRVLYVKGEIDVSAAGTLDVDLGTSRGISMWLDDATAEAAAGSKFTWNVGTGRHTVILRLDTTDAELKSVKVKIAKAAGSSAEFTIVGGR